MIKGKNDKDLTMISLIVAFITDLGAVEIRWGFIFQNP